MVKPVPAAVALAIGLLSSAARATPKPLPFTYGADTNPKGQGEVEQTVDLVPVTATDAFGRAQKYLATQLQTEVEYGLTDHVELGLYATFAPDAPGFEAPPLTEGNGAKQRIRWRPVDLGEWPVDVALYGELSETNAELELEWKVIVERRFGPVRLLANAWFEYEMYFNGQRDWVFNPTAGVTVQATPNVTPGLEYWMRAEVHGDSSLARVFDDGPHHYLGPTLRLQFGNFFWTSGLYLRLSNFGRVLTPGVDSYGPVWFRSLVGFSF